MKLLGLLSLVLLAGGWVTAAVAPADDKSSDPPKADGGRTDVRPSASYVPPVLRNSEPPDDSVVTLPGPARKAPAKAAEASVRHTLPAAAAAKAALPADLQRDSAVFCQEKIGRWTEAEARALFGAALRQRPAYEDDHSVSGTIYAYSDPSGRYKELELDFDKATSHLRTVFAYPWKMTWQDCRRLWGADVSSTEAAKGRTFYSYLNRRLDVLVGPGGTVISLGLY